MNCERCERPARHRMTFGAIELADVCCTHADELMADAKQLPMPEEEREPGWEMWLNFHEVSCGPKEARI